jgi:hypothetical protein
LVYLHTEAYGPVSPSLPRDIRIQSQEVRIINESGSETVEHINKSGCNVSCTASAEGVGIIDPYVEEHSLKPLKLVRHLH